MSKMYVFSGGFTPAECIEQIVFLCMEYYTESEKIYGRNRKKNRIYF